VVNSTGQIRALTKANSFRIIFMVRANTNGPTVVSTAASGSITKWRLRALSPGVMADDTSVAIRMIRSTVKVLLNGLMAESILVSGAKESSTAKACTSKKAKRGKASGKWASVSSGSNRLLSKQTVLPNSHELQIIVLMYLLIFAGN